MKKNKSAEMLQLLHKQAWLPVMQSPSFRVCHSTMLGMNLLYKAKHDQADGINLQNEKCKGIVIEICKT
ncbi:hypothetical protein [Ectobacillus sp. sgz5001026]|uniref:hypothetical protein n=1 Tax=Ectobacillus sp. sgz5001026 TaxID=3242473 RepID=UPI0036D30E83